MEEAIFKNGEEVEVTSEEEGFKGAWFKATILEDNTKSSGKKELMSVRYSSLLNDDGLTPLTETIDQRLIRPVPPENDVVLEEGSVVDADYKDGWWIGTLLKKRFEDDVMKFLVYFDSPVPHIIEFEKKQLRAHFDWNGLEWVRPEIKEVDKSEFSPGTMVEVSSTLDNGEVTWLPAILIKEIEIDNEKKFIVKDCNKRYSSCTGDEERLNSTVDSRRVRPQPPTTCSVEEEVSYKMMDCVEVFLGSSWRKGFVRGVLAEKEYCVRIEVTNEEYKFKLSELRPFKVWENGVWHNGSELQPVKETTTKAVKRSLNREENAAETSKETSKGISPVTPSLVITETPLRRVEAETEGKKSPEKTLEEEENNEKDQSRKRKRGQEEQEHNSETDETCVASEAKLNDTSKRIRENVDDQPLLSASTDSNVVNTSFVATAADVSSVELTPTVLPFEKKSPIWKMYESTKSFKSVPQSPHFSPLLTNAKDDIREWTALGMIVAFEVLLKEVKELKHDSTYEKLNSYNESFAEYERYGFDILKPRTRISKVLSLKDEQRKKAEEKKLVEKEIEERKNEKLKFEEEMVKLQCEILELKKKEEIVKEKIEASKKKSDEMESNLEKIDKEFEEFEVKLQNTISAPW